MSQNRDMYEWGFLNQSGNIISAFSTFGVTGVQTFEGKLYLFASQPTEDGVVAVSGPQSVANGSRGICAFPGAHWARISGSASAGEEVGPVSGSPLLSSSGEGFVVVGGPISGRHLVAVRGGGGTESPEPADSSAGTVPFRVESDKLNTDSTTDGKLLGDDGQPVSLQTPNETAANQAARLALQEGPGAGEINPNQIAKQLDTDRLWRYDGGGPQIASNWTDLGPASVDVTLVDMSAALATSGPAGRIALKDYTGGTGFPERAYIGECRFTGIANWAGTGKPGYMIVRIEGPAPSLLVELNENGHESKEEYDVSILEIYGSNESNRVPMETEPGVFKILDDQGKLNDSQSVDQILVMRDTSIDRYKPVSTLPTGLLFEVVIPPVPNP